MYAKLMVTFTINKNPSHVSIWIPYIHGSVMGHDWGFLLMVAMAKHDHGHDGSGSSGMRMNQMIDTELIETSQDM